MSRKLPEKFVSNMGFCPGCGHGIAVRLICEAVEELGIENNFIYAIGCGCSSLIESATGFDMLLTAHGGPSAAVTGIKLVRPDTIALSYQGDGDAYVIGMSQTLNAAYRNENFTLIVINNTNFGMTGGQMAWTTMEGQKTSTCLNGRDTSVTGKPLLMPELIAREFDTAYVARGTLTTPTEINRTKSYIKKALRCQMEGKGHGMVEILSPCPTNWGFESDPTKALDRITEELTGYFKIGVLKDKFEEV